VCVLQVEKYMTEIVTKMRSELRDILRDSVVDYTTKSRDKWLFDWPSQIILVVNQVFWCQEVEQVCR
jgi:dynein heavy chain